VRISTTGKIWPPHSLYCTLWQIPQVLASISSCSLFLIL
jgi:hypothetical protein